MAGAAPPGGASYPGAAPQQQPGQGANVPPGVFVPSAPPSGANVPSGVFVPGRPGSSAPPPPTAAAPPPRAGPGATTRPGQYAEAQQPPPMNQPPPQQQQQQHQQQYQQQQQQQQQYQYGGAFMGGFGEPAPLPPPPQGSQPWPTNNQPGGQAQYAPGQQPPPLQQQQQQQQQQYQQQYQTPPAPMGGLAPQTVQFSFSSADPEQAHPSFMRMSVNCFPSSTELRSKWSMPLGAVIQPLADLENVPKVDVVNFGAAPIVRCKACRTYVNPFVRWLDGGRKWQCNMCGISNSVGPEYYCNLDLNTGKRADHNERPELCKGSCEFVAPLEYMVRPPQAPVYVFVLDVSYHAVQSGMVAAACSAIKGVLGALPGDTRTQVAFITASSAISVFNLKSSLAAPQMIVLPDANDVFLPLPDDLLVNLTDSMAVVTELLARLPEIVAGTADAELALGPALELAHQLIKPTGGKVVVVAASMPSLAAGRLKAREDTKLMGTDREAELLRPADDFYKNFAIACVPNQVSIDVFCGASSYQDFATLGCLAKYTCGEGYFYPAFTPRKDGAKFRAELVRNLTRETGFEAVMRVRLSRGLKITKFYGHYFVRGADLLSLPTVDADKAFGIEIAHEESSLGGETRACLQAALLYTTSSGERRIRVHTVCIPVTSTLADMYKYADVEAIVNVAAKAAVDRMMEGKISEARDWLKATSVSVLKTYVQQVAGRGGPGQAGNQLVLPESLKLLPLYTLALMKNPVFTASQGVRPDLRSYLLMQLSIMPVFMSTRFIHPRLFNLSEFAQDLTTGTADEANGGAIVLPQQLPLTAQSIMDRGVYLLDDAVTLQLWVGRAANPTFLKLVLGLDTLQGVDPAAIVVERLDNDLSKRFTNIVRAIRGRTFLHQQLSVVFPQTIQEQLFMERLIEDRNRWAMSYIEFLTHCHQVINQN